MTKSIVICLVNILLFVNSSDGQQRLAPGVPPQHYQQQQQFQQPHGQVPQYQQQVPPGQQQQQQHIPQQHVPQQHVPQQHVPQQQQHVPQQVPNQQQQVPVQHGQRGLEHGHHHGAPQPGQILNTGNILNEKEHIQEHMEVPIDTSKMSEQELQFHYFKMHDADNNNKLDGCELIKSLIHWHEQDKEGASSEKKVFHDEELTTLIDPILNMDDSNKDGYIDYPEFIRAQKKASTQPPK